MKDNENDDSENLLQKRQGFEGLDSLSLDFCSRTEDVRFIALVCASLGAPCCAGHSARPWGAVEGLVGRLYG